MKVDVLIIGSGIAGLSAAITLAERKRNIMIITRAQDAEESNTLYAQGGIAYKDPHESLESFKEDIISAGAGIVNTKAVDRLIEKGPEYIEEMLIKKVRVPFDRHRGQYDLGREGAHSEFRVLHSKDYTGKSIELALLRYIKKFKNVIFSTNKTAIDILTLSHHSLLPEDRYKPSTCIGAYVFNQITGNVETIFAKESILATGGLGQLYLHTTNPKGARGDGIAMAHRAGARIINLEYIQFHPTTLYSAHSTNRFLISEALRGQGAKLITKNGHAFMHSYHKLLELAPRDIVSQAIHSEMLKENSECVYLDISFKKSSWIKTHFPQIYTTCKKEGIDITKEPIPVVPSAHYLCGGIFVSLSGETTIRGLSAIGEVACNGLHGANRLASTSLLEGLVFGIDCGNSIEEKLQKKTYTFPKVSPWRLGQEPVDPSLIYQDMNMIKQTMWNYVGLTRSEKRLLRSSELLNEFNREIERFYKDGLLSDSLIGLRNMSRVSQLVIKAALLNKRSVGCHFRID